VRHVPVSGPLDALFINRQQIEIVGVFAPGSGLGESVIDLGVAGVVGRVLVHAQGERAGFDGAGTLQAPAVVGDGLRDVALKIADGGEGIEDDFTVLVMGLLLFGSEDAELAGESVAISIEAAAALAFGSLGACGMIGTQEVGLLGYGTSLFSFFGHKNGLLSAADHWKAFRLSEFTVLHGFAAEGRERGAGRL